MSIVTNAASRWLFGKLLNIGPVISKRGQVLVISPGWQARVFTLGAASRMVTVDPQAKLVRVKGRRFWFFGSSRRIPFDWIEEIHYGYLNTSGSWTIDSGDELFTVALKLKDGKEVVICRFYGQGDFVNNSMLPDWMFWEESITSQIGQGDQQPRSMALADTLSELIGVPVESMRP
jgi:hypothetical protein